MIAVAVLAVICAFLVVLRDRDRLIRERDEAIDGHKKALGMTFRSLQRDFPKVSAATLSLSGDSLFIEVDADASPADIAGLKQLFPEAEIGRRPSTTKP